MKENEKHVLIARRSVLELLTEVDSHLYAISALEPNPMIARKGLDLCEALKILIEHIKGDK